MATAAPTPASLIPPGEYTPSYLALEDEVIDWTESVYEQIYNDKNREKEAQAAAKIIEYLEGKQWSERARYSRSRPVVDKFSRHFWESVGLLTDLSLDFTVKMFDKVNDFNDLERILNDCTVRWAMKNGFEDRLYDVVLYGLLHTGPAKFQWKSSLNGGWGDVQIVPIAPWQFGMIGADYDIDDAEVICTWQPTNVEKLVREFGPIAKQVEGDPEYSNSTSFGGTSDSLRPSHISKERWQKLPGQIRYAIAKKFSSMGGSSSDAPYSKIALRKEFWITDDAINETGRTIVVGPKDQYGRPLYNWCYYCEPGMPIYPRGRLLLTGGKKVMGDSPNPYWHSKKPFALFRPYRVPWQISGLSPTRPWRQMSVIMNRIYGGVLDMIQAIIEPTLIAPKNAFPPGDWDALDPGMSGGKIKYNTNAARAPEFAKRAELPSYVLEYMREIDREYGQSSGSSAMGQALQKKQVPGKESLDTILSSRSFPVRVQSRALTSFIVRGGNLVIPTMLQFYTAAHRIHMFGARGLSSTDYLPVYGESLPGGSRGEDFVQGFDFAVRPGSTLSIDKADKVQTAFALRKLGDLSAKNLFRALDNNFNYAQNKDELIEEAKLKLLLGAAAASLSGKHAKK